MKKLNGKACLITGSANPLLGKAVAAKMDLPLSPCKVETFPDDETRILVQESMMDRDVYLIQSTGRPVSVNVLELLLVADACRRAGAARISGVIPYLAYARQDRREEEGEPVSARLMADLLGTRLDRVVCVDLHNPAIEGFFPVPVVHLSALSILVKRLKGRLPERAVIVSPDLGAAKLARRFADYLDLPAVYIHKERRSGENVAVRNIIGEVKGRSPILVDDMISTGGTMVSAVEALLEKGAIPDITIAATHGLFAGDALPRFRALPITRIIVTDSLETPSAGDPLVETVSLADLLAETIRGLGG